MNGIFKSRYKKSIKIDGKEISLTQANSLTIGDNIKFILNFLKKPIIDENSIKILSACNFLCDKLYQMYWFKQDDYKIITNTYSETVCLCKTLIEPLKISHSRFRNQEVAYTISKNIYDDIHNKRFELSRSTYFQILKHLLRSYCSTEELINSIFLELEEIFANPTTIIYEKMEIADMFLNIGKTNRGNELLNIIRQIEESTTEKTVFDDTQNVHNTSINDTSKEACKTLIKLMGDIEATFKYVISEIQNKGENIEIILTHNEKKTISNLFMDDDYLRIINLYCSFDKKELQLYEVGQILVKVKNEYSNIIYNVLERIEMETTIFDTFNLYQLFGCLWKFILYHKNSEELQIRLIEEMTEMNDYCTTGHLSRLINVIQGFTNIDGLQIKISGLDQIKSAVQIFLSKNLEKAPDYILDNMLDDDKTMFTKYVIDLVNLNSNIWAKEYGKDYYNHIVNIVSNYTSNNKISLEENILVLEI